MQQELLPFPFLLWVVGDFSAGGLTSRLGACSGAGVGGFLRDPENFAGVARHSYSIVPGCGLLFGFVLGDLDLTAIVVFGGAEQLDVAREG